MPPTSQKKLIVFVHGWSVTHTNTYGGLPKRIAKEASGLGFDVTVREVFLGKYISFRDEVRMEDLSRAFHAAVARELADAVAAHGRFVCITHSTGGPVVRDWWHRYYLTKPRSGQCPMSHLIMLAPANFGSALAQLGKQRLSRIKAWFQGVEPGTGVLDWLELGSPEAWALNTNWIQTSNDVISARGVFPFVLIGQTIDRKLYDALNSYTGESGSDGVVRVAAANLNATHVVLEQVRPRAGARGRVEAPELTVRGRPKSAPATPLAVIAGRAHTGKSRGIMRSVKPAAGTKTDPTVSAVLKCLAVSTRAQYDALRGAFEQHCAQVQKDEQIEIEERLLLDGCFVHDHYTMVIFRVRDHEGHAIEDFDLLLTGGPKNDANGLPKGFFMDRQRNRRHRGTLTYYLNHDVMVGCPAAMHGQKILRHASPGVDMLGVAVRPRPQSGFVHYLPCALQASRSNLKNIIRPNSTTLVDIVLRRVVREGVFRLDRGFDTGSFKKAKEGPPIG